jgi:hypothetical protein
VTTLALDWCQSPKKTHEVLVEKNGSNLVATLVFSTKHPDAKVQEAEQLEKGLQLLETVSTVILLPAALERKL